MEKLEYAVLENGKKLPYIVRPDPPHGGMKHTYFAPDKSYVVQFFNDPRMAEDRALHERLQAIIGRYNPTISEEEGGAKGNSPQLAEYFSKRFCWPKEIVKYPEFGIVCPTYPSNYFFDANSSLVLNLKGKDKKSNWFTSKNRQYLEKYELGDFKRILEMSILLARSVRRLHQAGLAHSDLSNNNVLIDPKSGSCVIIDIDSLVVPGIFPPEVVGTRGYMAPEVVASYGLPYGHPDRKSPSASTDLHALAVLLYEYLFCRHPLLGPKVYCVDSAQKDDFFALGSKAVFIENPVDTSNRPQSLDYTIQSLGPVLEKLFLRAFVDGLHSPQDRPTAIEWERGLVQTLDLLHSCSNTACEKKWFVLYDLDHTPVCPFCGRPVKNEEIVRIHIKKQVKGRPGHWLNIRELNAIQNTPIYKWHIFSNHYADEKADNTVQATISKENGNWIFLNRAIHTLVSPMGVIVPIGNTFVLKNNTAFRTCQQENGTLFELYIKEIK